MQGQRLASKFRELHQHAATTQFDEVLITKGFRPRRFDAMLQSISDNNRRSLPRLTSRACLTPPAARPRAVCIRRALSSSAVKRPANRSPVPCGTRSSFSTLPTSTLPSAMSTLANSAARWNARWNGSRCEFRSSKDTGSGDRVFYGLHVDAGQPRELEPVRRQYVCDRYEPVAHGHRAASLDVKAIRIIAENRVANVDDTRIEFAQPLDNARTQATWPAEGR